MQLMPPLRRRFLQTGVVHEQIYLEDGIKSYLEAWALALPWGMIFSHSGPIALSQISASGAWPMHSTIIGFSNVNLESWP